MTSTSHVDVEELKR
jgi:hypothetical protein